MPSFPISVNDNSMLQCTQDLHVIFNPSLSLLPHINPLKNYINSSFKIYLKWNHYYQHHYNPCPSCLYCSSALFY